VAMAAMNVVGSFFKCFPAAASLSRTSVTNSLGVRTTAHNGFYSVVILLTLVAITPVLYYLPKAMLASVVLFGVFKMIAFGEAVRLFKANRPDFLLWMVSFLVTLLMGAIFGILTSVAVSIVWLLKSQSMPSTAVLGRLPGTLVYRNVARFPIAEKYPGIEILRFDAPLHFANKDFFEAKVRALAKPETTHVIIIDASSINALDSSAVRTLLSMVKKLQTQSKTVLFANWKGPQRDFLDHSGFHEVVPAETCFLSLHDAVLYARQHQRAEDNNPPLGSFALDFAHSNKDVEECREGDPSTSAPTTGVHVFSEKVPGGGSRRWNLQHAHVEASEAESLDVTESTIEISKGSGVQAAPATK